MKQIKNKTLGFDEKGSVQLVPLDHRIIGNSLTPSKCMCVCVCEPSLGENTPISVDSCMCVFCVNRHLYDSKTYLFLTMEKVFPICICLCLDRPCVQQSRRFRFKLNLNVSMTDWWQTLLDGK